LVREIYYFSKKVLYCFLSVHWTKKLVLARTNRSQVGISKDQSGS
jgi:hypothetical protein